MSSSSLQHIRLGQGLGQPPGDCGAARRRRDRGAGYSLTVRHQSVRVAPRGAVGCGLFGSTWFAPDRLAEFDELIAEALNNPVPVQKAAQ